MTVKGSKQYQSIVVTYRPWYRLSLVAFLTVLVCGVTVAGFIFGYREANQDHQRAVNEWNQLQDLAKQQEAELQQLKQQTTNTQVGSDVDRRAMEGLRQQIIQLNERITSLQESNNFYRQLMEPGANLKGLTIGSWNVTASTLPRRYHYQLVIQQFASDHRTLTGKINITVTGKLAGQPHSYALHELSSQASSKDIPLKIRFYQTIEGDMVLPEGFEPQNIDVGVERAGGDVAPLAQSFGWMVKN